MLAADIDGFGRHLTEILDDDASAFSVVLIPQGRPQLP
jgi:hypothetical protein